MEYFCKYLSICFLRRHLLTLGASKPYSPGARRFRIRNVDFGWMGLLEKTVDLIDYPSDARADYAHEVRMPNERCSWQAISGHGSRSSVAHVTDA